MNILKERTKSICPICFKEIDAKIYEKDKKAFMSKSCNEHGSFEVLIEKDARIYKKLMNKNELQKRIPFTNLMIPVTYSCNLNCPICYFPHKDRPDLPLEDIKKIISDFEGPGIRISGGEPTLREDLPEIINFIRKEGKTPVLITNGLKLAEAGYVKKLKASGLQKVSFSFNGLNDEVYNKINGRPLLNIKLKSLKNLMREKIKVILSVMLLKGTNDKELKKIYRFYIKNQRYFDSLRIRAAVFLGRYNADQEQTYLSEIIDAMSHIIGVSSEELIEMSLALNKGNHLPCQIDFNLAQVFLRKSNMMNKITPLFNKIKFGATLLKELGLINVYDIFMKKLLGRDPFLNLRIFIRVWHDKYRIDLVELGRCPSSHLVGETGNIVPFCYGLIFNDGLSLPKC